MVVDIDGGMDVVGGVAMVFDRTRTDRGGLRVVEDM